MNIAIVDTLMAMINRDVVPLVPSQGSSGSSGDLAPLVGIAFVLADVSGPRSQTPDVMAWLGEDLLSGAEAMRRSKIPQDCHR